MPTLEGFRLKIQKISRIGFANLRRKKLNKDDFTIISNNCWGGMIYESYNLKKQSPTVGLFFMATDYLKFLMNLKEYLTHGELIFINPEDSKYKRNVSSDERFGHYPIGVLKLDKNDQGVEIFFFAL